MGYPFFGNTHMENIPFPHRVFMYSRSRFLPSTASRDGFSQPGSSLLYIIHQTSPWYSIIKPKHQKIKTKLLWEISNRFLLRKFNHVFLRKLNHKKLSWKRSSGPFCKKIQLEFQVFNNKFLESRTNLQPARSFIHSWLNQPALSPHTLQPGARSGSDPWIQQIWNFKLKFSWNSNF